jgi:hypothetical protein
MDEEPDYTVAFDGLVAPDTWSIVFLRRAVGAGQSAEGCQVHLIPAER